MYEVDMRFFGNLTPLKRKSEWGYTLKELIDWAAENDIDPLFVDISAEAGYVLPDVEVTGK
jgi:hypothetical protein